jgi:multidrug efflux system membrane fusion protein
MLAWLVILLVFAGVFYYVLHHKNPTPAAGGPGGGRRGGGGPVAVTPATAQRGEIGVYLDAIGTVTPVYTASITSQVNGQIVAVHYKEGQIVRKGTPLVDIDDRPYRATLMQAQGTLDRDNGVLAQARQNLARYQAAWARNAIPKQTLDDQEKIVIQAQGTVKTDEGTVQYDQVQVGFCHIVSPITGRVGLRLVDPGNIVTANGSTVLAVVTQVQPVTVIFTLAEDSLNQVAPRLRQHARLTVDAYDRTALKKIATGTLLSLDNQIDTTTGTVKARASFANKDQALYPNEFVNTRLLVDTLHDATLIPSSTIQHNGQAAFVYVLQDGKAHMRSITSGVTEGGTTQVTGINPGDVLANSSFDKLTDGAQVNLASNQGGGGKASPQTKLGTGSDAP